MLCFSVCACVRVCVRARAWCVLSSGGVILTALNGTIKCDNTLDTRAQLAIRDLQPVVRYMLFPSCRSKPVIKPVAYVPTERSVALYLVLTPARLPTPCCVAICCLSLRSTPGHH